MATNVLSAIQCKTWEKSGKLEFVNFCKDVCNDECQESIQRKDLKRALYELFWQVIHGAIKPESAISVVQEIVDVNRDVASLIVDIFSVIDIEIQALDDPKQKERWLALVPCSLTVVPDGVLKERLEPETLEKAGLIDSKSSFQSKYIKTKTKLYYKQQKFNLLREENEGYSKLVTELNCVQNNLATQSAPLDTLISIIGCFNLDPNRVLDIVLDAFESQPEQWEFFISLLKEYVNEKNTLCQLLGFKFHFYQEPTEPDTPASLYKVAALLMHHKLVDLDALYPHLLPNDTDIVEEYKRELADAKELARKLQIVNLSENKDKEKDEKDKESAAPIDNQKMGLCEALLQLGDWTTSKLLIDRLPPFWLASKPPITTAICNLVHFIIDPHYVKNSGLPNMVMKKRKRVSGSCFLVKNQIRNETDLNNLVFPILRYLGPHASNDPILINKILRLGKALMAKRSNHADSQLEEAFRGFMTILDDVILPSLTLLPGNCSLSEDIWMVMKQLKYEQRYRLYGQWKNDSSNLHPRLIRAKAECLEKAKYIMKRLSKENFKMLGRQLGKLSHNNPVVVFEYVLSQIQKYENLIGPVVDALKFLTTLSYDVLAFCIIEGLANPDRQRLKLDDTNLSLWLQSLACFCASIFKKYNIELSGLIQYVVNQLKAGKSFDLLILREVVQKMAGIEVSEEITSDQLEAMSGGEQLKLEGGYFSAVRNTKRSSSRLKEALNQHQLAIPLCILMAQQRNNVLFSFIDTDGLGIDNRHVKMIGKLYDQCQETFVQFNTFLGMQLTVDEFGKRLPPINKLLSEFHLAPDASFALTRMICANSINVKFEELKKQDKKDKQGNSQSLKVQRFQEAFEMVIEPLAKQVVESDFAKVWNDLSPKFYVMYWTLNMNDLHVPDAAYEKQISILDQQLQRIDDNKELAQGKKKRERERCQALKDKLCEEQKKQQEHVKLVMAHLEKEKEDWFPQSGAAKNAWITPFLQQCIFPRCCFTAIDAIYSAYFIHTLHKIKTPNFSSLLFYDRILSEQRLLVTSCTESEAHRYGRFLNAILNVIMRWHSDQSIYDKECGMSPGFVTVIRNQNSTPGKKPDQLDYENFRRVCHKWHFGLTKSFIACIESGEYIQIRNALIVLTKLLPNFPVLQKFGTPLGRRVSKLCEEEKETRPDLYVLALGYAGQLKKKTLILETDFHIKEPTVSASKSSSAESGKEPGEITSPSQTSRDDSAKETSDIKSKSTASSKTPSSSSRPASSSISVKKEKVEVKRSSTSKAQSTSRISSPTTSKPVKVEVKTEGVNSKVGDKRKISVKKEKGSKAIKTEDQSNGDHESSNNYAEEKHRMKEERQRIKEERREEKRALKDEHRHRGGGGDSVDHASSSSRGSSRSHEMDWVERESASYDRGSGDREREWERERARREERAPSAGSSGSGGRHSRRHTPEASPKQADTRESKRRKVDNKDLHEDKERSSSKKRSPSIDHTDRERSKSRDARKRDYGREAEESDNKRYKAEADDGDFASPSPVTKVNGETVDKKRSRSHKSHRKTAEKEVTNEKKSKKKSLERS